MNPDENGVLIITSPLNKTEQAKYLLQMLRQFYGNNNPSFTN